LPGKKLMDTGRLTVCNGESEYGVKVRICHIV
jgi:hypothetical protein